MAAQAGHCTTHDSRRHVPMLSMEPLELCRAGALPACFRADVGVIEGK